MDKIRPAIDPAATLREHDLKVTAQRLAVLRTVDERPHTTADAVEEAVRGQLGTISRQSVYDTLSTLTDTGILRRIQPAGSATRYETRVGDNHHHLVCRSCDVLVDVDCAVGDVPCLTAADELGFHIDEAEVTWWGTCPDCRAASEAART